ncbi:hypothetical protein OEZ49_15175, partial [Ruegeria sp. WL0004]
RLKTIPRTPRQRHDKTRRNSGGVKRSRLQMHRPQSLQSQTLVTKFHLKIWMCRTFFFATRKKKETLPIGQGFGMFS